jgi:hypothetical protein
MRSWTLNSSLSGLHEFKRGRASLWTAGTVEVATKLVVINRPVLFRLVGLIKRLL